MVRPSWKNQGLHDFLMSLYTPSEITENKEKIKICWNVLCKIQFLRGYYYYDQDMVISYNKRSLPAGQLIQEGP